MTERKNTRQEQIRITISLGIIAGYLGAFFVIKSLTSPSPKSLFFELLDYFFFGLFTIAIISLIGYIFFTGMKYKYRNPGYMSSYYFPEEKLLYFPEKLRLFLYDFGMDTTVVGILYTFFYFLTLLSGRLVDKFITLSSPYDTLVSLILSLFPLLALLAVYGHWTRKR